MNNIPYGRQHITTEDIEAVIDCLKSDFLTQGPKVREFEELFADYIGAKYAVAVSNGTAALHLCTLALNVNSSSVVITTPITFSASANCVLYCGGRIEFCDIDPASGLLDIVFLEKMLSSNPKGYYTGIIAVDFAGAPCDLEKIKELAKQYNAWVIEDACHAPGGYFTDSKRAVQKCGNGVYAELAVFSFHPVKHIATGEGGMITTNDKALYDRLMVLRTHGIERDPARLNKNDGGWYHEMQSLGYNYRIPDMLCALGITQLAKAEEGIKRRTEIAICYDEAFVGNKNIKLLKPLSTKELLQNGIRHAYHLYIIEVPDRKGLYDYLRSNNIFPQVHYIPVHTMPYYRQTGHKGTVMPAAEKYYTQCLSLPMYPSLTDAEQEYVIDKVLSFVNE